jgi:prolyl-tRNA editing enzyme YbaK/EbsC (Cys-tRNA(Pro) deacylase)
MTQKFSQTPEQLDQFLDFIEEDLENIRRVKQFCQENGVEVDFIVHGKAETVEESAENTGVDPSEIVKTLVFIGEEPVAVLCPGNTSVSEEKLEDILGTDVRMADPEEVEEATGYTVGGVSPFDLDIKVLMEEELFDKEEVKPAAGSRVVGLKIDPNELKKSIDAETVDVSR